MLSAPQLRENDSDSGTAPPTAIFYQSLFTYH
jgi:hypothetical protein